MIKVYSHKVKKKSLVRILPVCTLMDTDCFIIKIIKLMISRHFEFFRNYETHTILNIILKVLWNDILYSLNLFYSSKCLTLKNYFFKYCIYLLKTSFKAVFIVEIFV